MGDVQARLIAVPAVLHCSVNGEVPSAAITRCGPRVIGWAWNQEVNYMQPAPPSPVRKGGEPVGRNKMFSKPPPGDRTPTLGSASSGNSLRRGAGRRTTVLFCSRHEESLLEAPRQSCPTDVTQVVHVHCKLVVSRFLVWVTTRMT